MEKTDKTTDCTKECIAIERILSALNIAEKKARIYSRLLTEVSLAKAMEELACKQEEQKVALQKLLYGKAEKKKKGGNMDGGDE